MAEIHCSCSVIVAIVVCLGIYAVCLTLDFDDFHDAFFDLKYTLIVASVISIIFLAIWGGIFWW